MILLTTHIIKVLLVLVILFVGWHHFRNRLINRNLISLGILIVLFALISNFVSGFLPPVMEQITLTAQDKKCDASKGTEVYLAGYTIDGNSFVAGKSLHIKEGHWFWSGEAYAWRPETDDRQPDGLTRAVVFDIPVGWSRTLDFVEGQWRGLVEINSNTNIWTVDTYSVWSTELGRSKTWDLIWNQIRYLILYTIVLLLLSAATVIIIKIVLQNPEKSHTWIDHNTGRLICGSIALVTFVLMIYYADKISFWCDELYQVYFTKGTLKEALNFCLGNDGEFSPPLQLLFSTVWYHIAPYGERWLLLFSILTTVLAIYLVGITAEEIGGRHCGVLAAVLMATSTVVWVQEAFEYRAYAFFSFFSALTLYCCIKYNKCEKGENWAIAFSIAMLGLAMTHYFGMLACASIFLAESFFLNKNRFTFQQVIPYILPGLISMIWLMILLYSSKGIKVLTAVTWYSTPTIASIVNLLFFITGWTKEIYIFMLLGIVIAIFPFQKRWIKFEHKNHFSFFSFLIICNIAVVFIYGLMINQNSSLWTYRYFLFLIPCVNILVAMVIKNLIPIFFAQDYKSFALSIINCLLGIYLSLNLLADASGGWISIPSDSNHLVKEDFRGAADWIYTQSNDIFNNDTLIFTTSRNAVADGWEEYYVTRQGRRDSLNVISQNEVNDLGENLLLYKKIYMQYNHNALVAEPLRTILNENYTVETDRSNIKVRVYVRNN